MNYQASSASNSKSNSAVKAWINAFLLGAFLIVALCLLYFTPLRHYLVRMREVSQQVQSLGPFAPLVFSIGVAFLVTVGFPRLLFCVISGMAFGFVIGFLSAQIGTFAGNYLAFVIVRWTGGEWTRQYLVKKGFVANFIKQEGTAAVIIARQLPVPGLLLNFAFGLSPIRQRHFILGTLIGQVPEAIPCTLIGAGMLQASFMESLGWIALSVVGLLLGWLALRRLSGTVLSNGNEKKSESATP